MANRDFTSERLFIDAPFHEGAVVALSQDQTHYLAHVLRMAEGARLLVFNGRDGEWRARIASLRKRDCMLELETRTRAQAAEGRIDYLFAPLKHARLDYMVQKAVEMGVARLSPVMTRRTVPQRVNLERMRANAIEAAEQCGVLSLPRIDEPRPLVQAVAEWDETRPLIFCDEAAPGGDALCDLSRLPRGRAGVLIGPEGGFAEEERQLLLSKGFVTAISLGPRILRADTAAVAVLALVNATLGDWTKA